MQTQTLSPNSLVAALSSKTCTDNTEKITILSSSKDILLENLSNLVEAVLEITDTDIDVTDIREYGNRVWVFIRTPYNVKSLHLDSRTTKCLCNAFDFDPPMFHKLAYLKFGFGRHSLMEHLLPLLLHRAPKLAVHIFDKVC
uniref:Uncharacterized protein n=1 Tax=Quercus lobata TaxID=97700 RepID=A0A7N2M8L9_QUELO